MSQPDRGHNRLSRHKQQPNVDIVWEPVSTDYASWLSTQLAAGKSLGPFDVNTVSAPILQMLGADPLARITSYNVCYTKLLRA